MKRVLFFPEPYPNEDFRSIIFRYHLWTGNGAVRDTKEELFEFGSNKWGYFPRNLSSLLSKFPKEYGILKDDILDHTWFPLYKPFLEPERCGIVMDDIMHGKNIGNNYVGRIAMQRNIRLLSKTIKYCLVCMQEDYKRKGESYVHLEHQLCFLDFCSNHFVKLIEQCPECHSPLSNRSNGTLSVKPCCNSSQYIKVEQNSLTKLKLRILKEFMLLKKLGLKLEPYNFYMKIIAMLGKHRYIHNISGCIDMGKLVEDLIQRYDLEILNLICDFESFINVKSQHFLYQRHIFNHILIYILLILFLEGSVDNLLKITDNYSIPLPFGSGPWPCHNPFCSSFQLFYPIRKCKRTINRKRTTGRFICTICGFEYMKNEAHADTMIQDEFKIVNRGFLWKEKILELYNDGYKMKDIATMCDCSEKIIQYHLKDRKSISVGLTKISESVEEDVLRSFKEVSASSNSVKESFRQKIIDLKRSYGTMKRTELKKIALKEYHWLLKNDREWLDDVIPKFKLNYKQMDQELFLKVRVAAEQVYKSNPPKRIRRNSILNKLKTNDKYRIISYKEKLPLTTKELNFYIESLEDHQLRRIPSLFSLLKASGCVNITWNTIQASRKSYRNCSDETKQRIIAMLEDLQRCH